jgi:hypothetical protein
MKLNVFTAAMAATMFGALSANAQTTVIEHRPPAVVVEQPAPPAVVVEQPSQSVTVEHNDIGLGGILGSEKRTTVETTGAGVDCRRQTTQTNTLLGSNTTTHESCN